MPLVLSHSNFIVLVFMQYQIKKGGRLPGGGRIYWYYIFVLSPKQNEVPYTKERII